MSDETPDRVATIFSSDEERSLNERVALDAIDRQILTLIILHPRWSNEEIGEQVGLNRVQIWKRRTKGPLAIILLEFQKEALFSAQDLVINEAHSAVRRLGQLARGECDCSKMILEQSDNHATICLNKVPYAVQRQAAKDLIEILTNRKREDGELEEEVWEAAISEVGGIQTRKQIAASGAIEVNVNPQKDEE